MTLQEVTRCTLDGWRRDHVLIDGLKVAICPFCHQQELVECA